MSYRIRDLIIASLSLVILSPVFLLIVIVLKLAQDQVFFLQKRPGKDEVPFILIKFSTLRPLREGEQAFVNEQNRLTPVGKWLRKLSLDELPQLLNVIQGNMSIVGPRPLLMDYLPLYTPAEHQRHSVKPGITGWAQIHGRNSISFKRRFEMDLWYIAKRSHKLDLQILMQTFTRVLSQEGVYNDSFNTSPKFDGTN